MTLLRLFLLLAMPAAALAAEQRNEFVNPVQLSYGDPSTVAPMMGPCLTVDWDRDGRADLVGSGRWWRDSGEKRDGLAIFEPGGAASISAPMIGDLDGDQLGDYVVAGREEYAWHEEASQSGERRFERKGPLAWAIGGKLVPPGVGESPPACWLADWDQDGRTDLLAGTRSIGLDRYLPKTGPGFGVGYSDGTWLFRDMTATVWLHRNVGTPDKPVFSAGNLVTTGPTRRAITFFDQATPMAVDWNGDGKPDLLVGAFDRMAVFLNVGPGGGMPQLDDGHLVTFGGEPTLPYERRSYFPFRDPEGLWHLRFGGPTASEAIQIDAADPFRFGPLGMIPFRNPELCLDTFAVPDAEDWDGDGKIDLVVGCEDGWIWLFENLDPAGGVSRWAAPVLLEADGRPIRLDKNECLQGPCEWLWGYSNPTVADWDLDGDLDLVCGSTAETYVWFENVGTRTAPKLTARGPLRFGPGKGEPVRCAWRTRPGIGDLDGDGLPDLVGVAGNRQLCWWRRGRDGDGTLRLARCAFPVDAAGKPFTITGETRATGRSKIVVCDWDHDGRADVISSPQLGRRDYQLFFHNRGVKDGSLVLEFRPEYLRVVSKVTTWGHYAMCEPVDFDGDGLWEALAGIDRGQIYYFRE